MKNPPSESVPLHSGGCVSAFLVVLLALAALVCRSTSTAQTSFVRVHQAGYVANAPKRGYFMSSASSSGASFSVLHSSGSPVYSGTIGASQGSWGSFTHVYVLDFDTVTNPGTYRISVSGSISATSPSFPVDSGANLYSTPRANILYFYENERDGERALGDAVMDGTGGSPRAVPRFL